MLSGDIIEALYILYMFNVFKTKHSINHPFEYILCENTNIHDYFKHPINQHTYENKICLFGKQVSLFLAFWILLRNYHRCNTVYNTIIFVLLFIGSILMNMNAFVYLIPVFIYEYLRFYYMSKK